MIFNQKWTGYAIADGKYSEGFPVTVPGNIQKDYADHLGWGDVGFMDNCRKYLDIEDWFWSYKTDIEYTPTANSRVYFVTLGIEYEYDVILNGKKLVHHEGMFSKVEIDITDELTNGNALEILIYPHPKRPGAVEDRALADQSCKPAVEYGWDWHPRVLISGLWNETYIETRTESYINSAEPFYTLSEDMTSADLRFEIDCKSPVTVELFDMDGNCIYKGGEKELHLENIHLWWCNGQGVPYLYSWKVSSTDCERKGRIGFKRVRLIQHEGAWDMPNGSPKSHSNPPITLELNGRVVFVKGSNWVNPEIFTARIAPETYITQVDYAKEANMNLLRAWGGAILDRQVFFGRCDEQGIMVWQEFPLSCNNHVGTPSYLRILEQEAVEIIKQVRHHACHVLWCGGNELFNKWSGMTEQSHALRLLDKLTYEQDFDKPFIMTSPLSGMAHGHYDFYLRKFGITAMELYPSISYTAYPEFGNPSIASMDKLLEIFTDEVAHDPSNTDLWTLHHGFKAFEFQGWAGFDSIDLLFGKQTCMKDYIEKSNFLQSESLKFIFEECRRQKPVCSMALNWCYNEPWVTAAGTSLLTYPSLRKPAYFHVKEALRPVLPSARIEHFTYHPGDTLKADIWLLNDTYDKVSDTVEVYITVDGVRKHLVTWNTPETEPNKNVCGPSVTYKVPDAETQLITLTLEAASGKSEYRVLLRNDPPEEKVLYAPKLR